jgi:carbon-monoxide dehydrogenase medium subunit
MNRFDYVRPASVDEAVKVLVDAGGEGKLLAGGQSLVPVLALRMARPSVLVDVNRIPGLAGIRPEGDGAEAAVRVGALTRHAALTRQPHHPLLAEAARWIGHTAIRTRGTTGGSIAHADPSAELPVVAVGTGATVTVAGPAGVRTVPAEDLFAGALMTSLADDEVIVDVRFPVPTRWGFAEFARRHGDFALAGLVATARLDAGRLASPRLVYFGCAERAHPARATIAALDGAAWPLQDGRFFESALAADLSITDAPGLRADTRLHMAQVLTRRVVNSLARRT